jgi:hypothetical protein
MFDFLDFTPGWDLSASLWAVSFAVATAGLESRKTLRRAARPSRRRRRANRATGPVLLPARGRPALATRLSALVPWT